MAWIDCDAREHCNCEGSYFERFCRLFKLPCMLMKQVSVLTVPVSTSGGDSVPVWQARGAPRGVRTEIRTSNSS